MGVSAGIVLRRILSHYRTPSVRFPFAAGHTESEPEKHLPRARAARERQTANEHHKYDLTQAGQRLKNAEDHRKVQREKFEVRFSGIVQ
ncbi:hypothetical protein BSKO_04892 [Bryopsis sp. KO-2023]|nr:hypothetical protein BSKO_04892 [Bryopsis sp. KO-2023]